MANSERGESEITLGSKTYRLKLGTGALREAQESVSTRTDFVRVEDLFAQAALGRIAYVIAILWAAMQRYYPGTTRERVEEIIDTASEDEVTRMLRVVGGTTAPDPRDVEALELQDGGPRPRTAQATPPAGIGEGSTSTPGESA